MQELPAIHRLEQRQLFQRTGRIIPTKEKIDRLTIVNCANLDQGFAAAIEIAAMPCQYVNRARCPPNRVRCVSIDERNVLGIHFRDAQGTPDLTLGREQEGSAHECGGECDQQRI